MSFSINAIRARSPAFTADIPASWVRLRQCPESAESLERFNVEQDSVGVNCGNPDLTKGRRTMEIPPPPKPLLPPIFHAATPPQATRSLFGWGFCSPAGTLFSPQRFPGYWTLHLAEMSKAVYGKELDVRKRLVLSGDPLHIRWFDVGSTQAVGYIHEGQACLVFRGTQEKEDWYVDAKILLCGLPGRHLGFQRAWQLIQPQVLVWLGQITSSLGFAKPQDISLVLAGHSLGGALAVVAAWELASDNTINTIAAVRTFGAPRVGSPEFAIAYRKRLGDCTMQFRHDEDLVPIVPPPVLFQHVTLPYQVHSMLLGGTEQLPKGFAASLTSMLNMGPGLSRIANISINKDPLIVLFLTVISLLVLYTSFVASSITWLHTLMHRVLSTRPGFGILFCMAVAAIQQFSFAIRVRVRPVMRWLLALMAVSVLSVIHTSLLLFTQVLVWTLINLPYAPSRTYSQRH
jgi:hypothetical protein